MMARRASAFVFFVFTLSSVAAVGWADTARQNYILLLRLPNATAAPSIVDDVAASGGSVVARGMDRLMITLPEPAVNAIKTHAGVKYLQLATTGPQPVVTPAAAPASPGTNQLQSEATALRLRTTPLWDSSGYAYDGAGNITSIGTTSYAYDPLSRLTAFATGGHTETYTYDEFGNTLGRVRDGASYSLTVDSGTNHVVDAYNQSLHDTAGNLTQSAGEQYQYDPFNELREKDVGAATREVYVYTADDERIGVRTGTDHWTWSIRDEEGEVIRQYESFENNGPLGWTWIEDYVYRDGELLGAERMPEEGGRRHFHLDHLGTPRLITGNQGQIVSAHDYFPFGTEITAICQESCAGFSREEPMRFTGQERDFNTYNNN